MQRKDLKDLGLEDSTIDSVMRLHGKSLNEVKGQYSDYDEIKSQKESLDAQIKEKDKSIKELRGKAKDTDKLNEQIKNLENEKQSIQDKSDTTIHNMKVDNAVNAALTSAKARNNKPIKAMLNMDKIELQEDGTLKGLDDQVESLKQSDAYLFDTGKHSNYEPGGDDKGGKNEVNTMTKIFTDEGKQE